MRIGHGFDVHRFGPGDHVMIGGVSIPFDKGLEAHSDGDVLIHAICDALLGGAGLGDIGQHFPDTAPEFSGINSRKLLRHVVTLLKVQELAVGNVDSTIVAEAPKMTPHIETMCDFLADDLSVDVNQVNIKATTTEKLGYIGRKEGIAVHAVALLIPT